MFVSEALVGEPVGLVRYDDRCWTVRFGHLEIGRLDGYALRIIKTPVRALPNVSGLALPMSSVGHERGGRGYWRRPAIRRARIPDPADVPLDRFFIRF